MQFNSEANNNDLYSDCRFLCGLTSTDTTSYTTTDFARNANFALDRMVGLVLQADNKWEWDDINQTDIPIATTDLVNGQADYGIATAQLKITRCRVKDSGGNFITLDPVNRRELSDATLNATSGQPRFYEKFGNSIILYPTPNYASTAGLEIQVQRGAVYFIPTDTTKAPGFASQFHRLVSLYGARDYCSINDLEKRLAKITAEITTMEADFITFYGDRDRDTHNRIKMAHTDYGEIALDNNGPVIQHPTKGWYY